MVSKAWVIDATERVVFTFAETVCGLMITNTAGITSLDGWRTAAVSAVPATLTVVKALLAGLMGSTMSPASMAPQDN